MEIYLVGGAVRDALMARQTGATPHADRDWVVVGATPEAMTAQGFLPVGRDFPVFLHPQTREEYALARTERKTAPGYHGFAFHADPGVTLEDDLARRDLTINAMARDATTGELVDPFGGQRDLAARVLRHVSVAFVEDPVRVLRVARFAARFAPLGFSVAPETMTLMREIAARGELDALVPERVWQETQRALEQPAPWKYFEVLREADALPVIFPELHALFGVPQPAKWHPEIDTGVHTLKVLEQATRLSTEPVVRFAALTHDLGKGTTPPAEWPRHIGHEQRGVELIEAMSRRLRVPNEYRDLAVLVARYHGLAHRVAELRSSTLLELLEHTDALRRPERFERFILACEADMRGRTGFEARPYPQGERLRAARAILADTTLDAAEREGLSGPQIAERLRRKRLTALEKLKQTAAS